jgi:predicted secreted protein
MDEYLSLPGFQEHCERLADETAKYLKSLIENAREPPIRILAILGVERSPACGVECTPVGRGEEKRYERRKGIFIDLLVKSLRDAGIEIPVIGVDLDRPGDLAATIDELISRHKP